MDPTTVQAPAAQDAGQPAGGSASQITGPDPAATTGQAATVQPTAGQQTSASPATSATQEVTFFDPKDLPQELVPAYKQMQAAWTKKLQAVSADRQKIQAYDAFTSDPVGQMQQLARQYGYSLTRGEAAQAVQQQQGQPQAWEPKSWDEVMERAQEQAERSILAKLQPHLAQIQQVRTSTIEAQLTELDPGWREHEDRMRENLKKHPTLVDDPSMLYRLSVPEEVMTSRAYQKALKRMEEKGQGAAVTPKSTVGQTIPTQNPASSFQEAVEQAKEELARKGRM